MIRYRFCTLFCLLGALFVLCSAVRAGAISQVAAESSAGRSDSALVAAREFVEKSGRYMHHDKLKRGMKGYGLSVFAGTKIEKFDVEIVSVVKNFGPGKDVILAMLAGQNLEKTRIIQGMSGSPVYIKDPADGKFKMVGAVAYGWGLSNEPLCGIQPITQMLAMPGILAEFGQKDAPTSAPASQPTPAKETSQPNRDIEEFLRIVLNPAKDDFAELFRTNTSTSAEKSNSGQLQPLAIPLLMSGCSPDFIQKLSGGQFRRMGLSPVQGGGCSGIDKKQGRKVKLAPGSSIAIPLVTGNVNWTAFGTVTDVINNKRVLAFGHQFNGDGVIKLPMSTGYVHTIVSNLVNSFKLGSSIREVGTLNRDETIGIAGVIGPKVKMIPMTVATNQVNDKRSQKFSYKLVNEWFFTARLAGALVHASATALRNPPLRHHVKYEVKIDFGKLGKYSAANIGTGSQSGWFGPRSEGLKSAASDTARPIAALMNNPFGPPPTIGNIEIKLAIHKGDVEAMIIDFKLDAKIYKPGDIVTGKVLLKRYRKDRLTLPVSFKLPKKLPDGAYTLTAGDSLYAGKQRQKEHPQIFNPRNVKELFAALQKTVLPRADRVYLHLPLPRGGIALGQSELPDLPLSKAQLIMEANIPDTFVFKKSIMQSKKTKFVIRGSKTATLKVQKQTNETLLR